MSEWGDGYRRALADIGILAHSRGLETAALAELLDDLNQDALVIGHEQDNKLQRRRLAAEREALPLFAAAGEAA